MSKTTSKRGEAVRKRQQISESGRQMFIWVASMSAVVGATMVVSWFLGQQIMTKTSVIAAKNETVSRLKANNEAVKELRLNVRALDANTALNQLRANESDRALQVILDALPAVNNPLALGASVEHRLTAGIEGLTLESLETQGLATGDEVIEDTSSADPEADDSEREPNPVPFTVTVNATNPNALRELLERFERSIRVVNVRDIKLEHNADGGFRMIVSADGYYQPSKVIELKQRKLEK